MPQEDNEAAELDHGEEVDLMMFPARDQSAEIVKPGEETLNFPAAAIAAQFATVLRGFSRAGAVVWGDQANAVFFSQALIERIAVVGPVTDHSFGLGLCEALLDGVLDEFCFMRRSAGDAAGDRKTMAVCDRHDFTAFSAASRADSSAPFFAELKLASMNVSDKSSLPRARKSSASVCNSRVKVPSRCHC